MKNPDQPTNGNGSRKRRFSEDPARKHWYAWFRAVRFRHRYFSTEPPAIVMFVALVRKSIQ